jgi:hypothetical protein
MRIEFLERAQKYTENRNDEDLFQNLYTGFREYNNIEDSVWKTLSYMYNKDTADLLKYQYWGPVL